MADNPAAALGGPRSASSPSSRSAVEGLGGGAGSVVWVEGEPGIGKSSLVAEAMADCDRGWDIGWGMADQLTGRLPLRVMLDCLQVRSARPTRGGRTRPSLLRKRQQSLPAGGDASAAGVEVLVTLVDELCAAAPTVLVVDDLQWADEASLVIWHQLAASIGQLPLLLVATCRPTPRRPEVEQVRAAVMRRGGAVVSLGPLPETDVAALVAAMVGAPPGDGPAPADGAGRGQSAVRPRAGRRTGARAGACRSGPTPSSPWRASSCQSRWPEC